MFARRLAAGFVLVLAGFATAQQGPQLNTVFPPGAKTGETVEVTFTGVGLDGDEKLLFSEKGFESERVGTATVDTKGGQGGKKGQPQATGAVKFKVTAPRERSGGTVDVRVVSKSGLSNPRAFVVGNLTEVNESEPNNDVDQAQKIAPNTTVNGTISAPTDVDYVRFPAKAGQNIVVYCLTTSIDSKLSADLLVATPDGKRLAENRGYRGGDAVLDFKAPADGDYLVRLSQFAYSTGGPDHFYRLTVTDGSWVDAVFPPTFPHGGRTGYERSSLREGDKIAPQFTRPDGRPFRLIEFGYPKTATARDDSLETGFSISPAAGMVDALDLGVPGGNLILRGDNPVLLNNDKNNTPDAAQEVKPPCDIAGRIGKKNDRHWYTFDAKKGEVWTLEVFADRIGSQMDAYFVLTDAQGKVIVEADDGPDTLSPNQFYTKSDDPARYRFNVPADGTYRVMVSARDAAIQFGVREQYVLRIAKENPDFRIAVMPDTPHLPDAGTVSRGGAVQFSVFVFRMDGFNDPIELSASGLPDGVKCPPQTIGAGQTRGSLVLTADTDAKDWEGFVTITAKAGKHEHTARPFTIVWTPLGLQANQPPPNSPMITRMDRGPGLALAVRGDAPFSLVATEDEVKSKPGGKLELTLKVTRDPKFKDGIQLFSAVPGFGPRQQGNQPLPPITTIAADKKEVKVSVDVQQSTSPGTYTLVLTGRPAVPPPKGGNNNPVRPVPGYPSLPVTVVVEGTPRKK
jgi:hypothetical protein